MEHTALIPWVAVLAVGTLLVGLCQHFRLSPVLGYLGTGLLVGPAGFNWLPDGPVTRLMAELGVVLLMFTLGLEFSIPRLLASKRLVLGLGSAQVVLTAVVLGALLRMTGMSLEQGVLLGVALAMSSTAIVLKQLGEQMELLTTHGRVVTAILLFQDLAAVVVLVVLPVLAADPSRLGYALSLALFKASVVFIGLLIAGRYLLPPLLHWVAATRLLELFMLTALFMALAAAAVSDLAGLSPTLGAFMAGMLLGETEFRHQVEADIRPFRDLMLGLFFVTIGMQLDPAVFWQAPLSVLLVVVVQLLVKPLLLAPQIRWFGIKWLDAMRTSISLAQGGEFGLLMVSLMLMLGVVANEVIQPIMGGIIVSMMLAPVLIRSNATIATFLLPRAVGSAHELIDNEAQVVEMSREFDRHVIICGYGQVGQNLMRILHDEGFPAIALDLDLQRVRQAAAAGETVIFANAAQPGVLRACGIERAVALVVTFDDPATTQRIVSLSRNSGFKKIVLVRSTQARDDAALAEAGAIVFPESLEVSLAFAGQLLVMLDVSPSRVESRLNSIRAEDYASLRVFFHSSTAAKNREESLDYPEQVRGVIIDEHHRAVGQTPRELNLDQSGVDLLNIQRGALRMPGNVMDIPLRPGDVLLLRGASEALEAVASALEG